MGFTQAHPTVIIGMKTELWSIDLVMGYVHNKDTFSILLKAAFD